jgi:hypothetical protein
MGVGAPHFYCTRGSVYILGRGSGYCHCLGRARIAFCCSRTGGNATGQANRTPAPFLYDLAAIRHCTQQSTQH